MQRLLTLCILCGLVACGASPTATAVAYPTVPPSPTFLQANPAQVNSVQVTQTAIAAVPFKRYTVDQVLTALQPLGIADIKAEPRSPQDQSPNTNTAQRGFTIPSIAPKGGQLLLFDAAADVAGMQAWYARFPDLAPYVYVKGNALLQLNSGLAKAEAERYRAALESLP